MIRPDLETQIAALAALDEPIRRGLYLYVAGRRRDVGRDEAARALRISRALAAFHLDKLVQQGLLETSYRRLSGRGGPGAGRPAKLYRRSARQLDVSLPQRSYGLAARLFAKTLAEAGSPAVLRALKNAAGDLGRSLGVEARRRAGSRPSRERLLRHGLAMLGACGYEPFRSDGGIRLSNCPFDALAREYRTLVCGTNLALLEGVMNGLGMRDVKAKLDPRPGMCCVTLRAARAR